ncbi:MAG: hypothetical protein ACYTEZ_01645 [Planctomycetota bacterium]|jgi:hypothetical protein
MRFAAVFLTCAGLVAAQSARQAASLSVASLKAGRPDRLLPVFESLVPYLLNEPDQARKVCESAAAHVRKSARKRAEAWAALTEQLVGLGRRGVDLGAEDANALVAYAEALLCRARLAAALGGTPRGEDWTKAADLCVEAHGIEAEEGRPLERAVRILREAAGAGVQDAAALKARADDLCVRGAKQHPRRAYFREALHRARLAHIGATLEGDRKLGKRLLKEYLESFATQPAAGPAPDRTTWTAYNDAVALARADKKLGLKAAFKTETIAAGYVQIDVPVSRRFKWDRSKGDLGGLSQYDEDGSLVRSVYFYSYKWTTNYYIDQKKFGGDNLKGLARLGEKDILSVIRDVKSRTELARRRLNRHIPHSQYFAIAGYDEDGDFLRWRRYYFKARETRLRTISVSVLDWGDFKRLDPMAEAVVDSIREPRRKR